MKPSETNSDIESMVQTNQAKDSDSIAGASQLNSIDDSEALENITKVPADSEMEAIKIANLVPELENPLMKWAESVGQIQLALANQFKALQGPIAHILGQIHEQMRPLQTVFKQIEENQRQWSHIANEVLGRLSKNIREAFPPEFFVNIKLRSQHWLIMDRELLSKLKDPELPKEAMGKIVVEYYKENNWEKFESLVEGWTYFIPSERLEHFKAYLHITKEIQTGEAHKATVPAIIAQLDGLVRHLRTLLPVEVKSRVTQEIEANLPGELKGKRIDIRKEVAVHVVAEVVDFWSADMLQELIFGGLFRDSKDIGADDSYILFRNKIIHGDPNYLSYGTEENFVRLMLYADFLIHLIAHFSRQQPQLHSNLIGE